MNFVLKLLSVLQMVIQFSDSCIGCDQGSGIKQKELERFVQKFHALSSDEVAIAMMVTNREIFNLLAQLVPCVGCRRRYVTYFVACCKGHEGL